MAQVLSTIYSLGAAAQRRKVEGPTLGIKMSDKHEREFSEAKLKAGQNVIGLQVGSTGCRMVFERGICRQFLMENQ